MINEAVLTRYINKDFRDQNCGPNRPITPAVILIV
jgi:hypothetical protein